MSELIKQMNSMYNNAYYWEGIPTLLGCKLEQDLSKMDIALIGNPWAPNQIERAQHLGPRAIRHRSKPYHRIHREFWVNPFELAEIRDVGDIPYIDMDPDKAVGPMTEFYKQLHKAGVLPFTVGGGHAIPIPVLRGIAGKESSYNGPISIIHFDSHVDAYERQPGSPICGSGVFARLLVEEGFIDPKKSVQVGINGIIPPGFPDKEKFSTDSGYKVLTLQKILRIGIEETIKQIRETVGDNPVYITFDLDVLTCADAPGVADPEADGLTIREARQILMGLRGMNVVGGDIVCFLPNMDPSQITAIHANAIMHDIVTMMAETVSRRKNTSDSLPTPDWIQD